jgi:hypothetical protein
MRVQRPRIYMTAHFDRWRRRSGISQEVLWEAIEEIVHGLLDARLRGNLVKKRIRLPGRGKRGGARTIVATNWKDRWCFLIGFAKNERENIGPRELAAMQELSELFLQAAEDDLARSFREIHHEGESQA